jgi:hypothetical protein
VQHVADNADHYTYTLDGWMAILNAVTSGLQKKLSFRGNKYASHSKVLRCITVILNTLRIITVLRLMIKALRPLGKYPLKNISSTRACYQRFHGYGYGVKDMDKQFDLI